MYIQSVRVSTLFTDNSKHKFAQAFSIFTYSVTGQSREMYVKLNLSFYLSESKPVQIVIPYEIHSTSVILFVQMPDTGVFDGIHIVIEGGPNVTKPLKHDNKITVGNLTPGTEYNFFVSIVSGTKLSNMYYVPAVKTCKYFGTYISFFKNFYFVSHFILVGYIHSNAVVFKDFLK